MSKRPYSDLPDLSAEEKDREAVRSILPPDSDEETDYKHTSDQCASQQEDEVPSKRRRLSDECNELREAEKSISSSQETVKTEPELTKSFEIPKFYNDSDLDSTLPISSSSENFESSEPSTSQMSSSAEGTLCAVVAAHYNSVPESGLDERNRSRILHLRNFNNWIKSMLIDEYVTLVRESDRRQSCLKVLDMGCGKGGDLFKWKQGKIAHLVCTDIAATSVEQCKERYNDMKQRSMQERHFTPLFKAEFIVANCTKDRLRTEYEDVTMQFDLVSCQFAFHYCFESLPQAECMMRNAAECLRPGGYFFGTCPNANAIISRVRKAGGKTFGNDVYSVEFETPIDDEDPPPIFGAKYNFHMEGVVDCPEFLVHFPTLIRLATRFGLTLTVCEPFHSYFDQMKEKGRGLLGRMQALETYPPFPDQTLMGPISQYEHAEQYVKEKESSSRVGTLSTAEWEAATLYLTFVFKKEKK